MRPISDFLKVLSAEELEQLHDQVIQLLADPGFHMDNNEVLRALDGKGADVDF
jgi:trimethylamine:corrinoid methyltransferase-like protein